MWQLEQTWFSLLALAFAGTIFFSLAGIQHVRNKASSRAEIAAMVSDLWLAAALIFYLLWLFSRI
jgi:hypothetical protein